MTFSDFKSAMRGLRRKPRLIGKFFGRHSQNQVKYDINVLRTEAGTSVARQTDVSGNIIHTTNQDAQDAIPSPSEASRDTLPNEEPADKHIYQSNGSGSTTLWEEACKELCKDQISEKLLEAFHAQIVQEQGSSNLIRDSKNDGASAQLSLHNDDISRRLHSIIGDRIDQIKDEMYVEMCGFQFNMREKVDKCVSRILSIKDFVGPLTALDPHASVAWAGILVILPLLARAVTEQENAIDGYFRVSSVMVRFKIVEDIYFEDGRLQYNSDQPSTRDFQKLGRDLCAKIIDLYRGILEYEIRIADYLSGKRYQRRTRDIKGCDKWNESLDRINSLQQEIDNDLKVIDRARWDKMERKLDSLHDKADELLRDMSELRDRLERQERDRLNKRLQGLSVDGASFYSEVNSDPRDRCLRNTRTELLEDIMSWARCENDKEVFLLKGVAGTGKSAIARTVATNLDREQFLVGSFFFARGQGNRGHGKFFVTSIASQLADQNRHALKYMCDTLQNEPGIATRSLSVQWQRLICEPLGQAEEELHPLVFVIDALDECEQSDIEKIIHLLAGTKFEKWRTKPKIFITSRPEATILDSFAKTDRALFFDLELHQIPDEIIKRDIRTFVEHYTHRIRDTPKISGEWPTEDQISTLVQRADRLFIYAATVCRYLEDAKLPNRALEKILEHGGSSSAKLDKIYMQILLDNFHISEDDDLAWELDYFKQIVGSLVVLLLPLSSVGLTQLLGLSLDDVTGILRPLYSVLEIPDNKRLPVKVFHQSFRDFLLGTSQTPVRNEGGFSAGQFHIDAQATHGDLAQKCIETMRMGLRRNICNLRSYGTLSSEVKDKVNGSIPEELRYACRYWVYHLQKASTILSFEGSIHTLLQTCFLHWLEAMSLMGVLSETLEMMVTLKESIQNTNPRLLSFLSDAIRFIYRHAQIASAVPLQLYASCLVFTPISSLVRKASEEHHSPWIHTLPQVENSWGELRQTLEGHSHCVNSVAFSPDGQTVASGSWDNTIKLWNAATGELRQTLEGHSDKVNAVAFSPDGQTVASGSNDNTIKLWNAATGELRQILEGHSDKVHAVAFSPDGQTVASGSNDNTIKLWNTATGELRQTLEGHSDWVHAVAFSPDGQTVASGSFDNTIKLWNAATGELRQTLEGHSHCVTAVAFSPDGQTVASASIDTTIKLWNAATGELRQTLEGHSHWVHAVAFSPDGQTVVSGSDDDPIKLWNAATGELRQTPDGHSHDVSAVVSHIKEYASPASDLQSVSPVSLTDQWVYMKGEKVLWLPSEYSQFSCFSTKEGALALGCKSGRVFVIQLIAPN